MSGTLGEWVALPAAWCAAWIIAVAEKGADLPVAAVGWSSGPLGIAVLTVICVVGCLFAGAVLARRFSTLAFGSVMVCALLVPLPSPGWPPRGWVMVACDVGQGDGLVLHAGPALRGGRGRRPRPGGDGRLPASARRAAGARSSR